MKSNRTFILLASILSISLILFGTYFWTAIGLGITLFFVLELIDSMGNRVPIIGLMTTMALLQWVLGPYIDYMKSTHHYKYHMYVDEPMYMSYVVPAIIVFIIGTRLFRDKSNIKEIGEHVTEIMVEQPLLPYFLVIGGLIVPYIGRFVPASLNFIFYLLSNAKYIGIIYLLFSGKRNRWLIFWIVMGIAAAGSIASGMFHDLILWAMLIFTFVSHELRLSFGRKIIYSIIGFFLALTIQGVKAEYRSYIWKPGYNENKVLLFLSLAANQWTSGNIINPSSDLDMNVRLNQGWIISAIMYHVPSAEPFAEGSTISDAITSSLLPRFLAPNKKIAGGRENFLKYTGLRLSQGTSMGISLVGEGYANYGQIGGIYFMFFWGLFIGWFWKLLNNLTKNYKTILIWSPILFLQVVKSETELVVVLNHLIKSSILLFSLLWLVKKQWNIRI